jgi:putative heme-binding domain-containing protein
MRRRSSCPALDRRPRLARLAAIALTLTLTLPTAPVSADGEPPPELVASTEPRTPEQEKAGFRLPPGFVIELVACEPEIHKPMNLAFDDQGRLWVTSSREYPFPKPVGEPGRDAVVVLEDFGPDGRARKATRFAEGLNIPIGVLPLREGALVHSIPEIRYMVDDDGDGAADRREVWYSSIGFRDTHGMANAFTWGFDGWIYACHGFANDSTLKGRDGKAVAMNSGNTFRMRADGSHVEQHTWGQVNPFGLAFDARGDLFSCDCHSRPIMMLLRGGYYPSFGKPHDGLGFAPEMMTHDHGSTGIAGIVVYEAEQFPEPWRGTVFIGNVVTSRINHDRIEWHGSSPKAVAQPDFLVSEDPWFRPVDLELGPDGALYVADFYNRIIGHYEVPLTHPGRDRERGRIWRIVYRGGEVHADPRPPIEDWPKASDSELFTALGDANLAVRMRAANELAARGTAATGTALRASRDETSAVRRAHGLWLLQRIGALEDAELARAAGDPDRLVRIHAMRVVGEREPLSSEARGLAVRGLDDPDPFVRRAAAEALGRHPSAGQLRPLLAARHAAPPEDTHLLHAVRIALRNQLLGASGWPSAGEEAYTEADLRALADVAPGVPTLASARFLLRHLQRFAEPRERLLRYEHHIARRGDAETDARLLELARSLAPDDLGFQAAQLREVFQGTQERGAELSAAGRAWAVEVLGRQLNASRREELRPALELAEALRLAELRDRLEALARDREAIETRLAAMRALAAIDPRGVVPALAVVLNDATEELGVRQQVAGILGQSGLDEAREALFQALVIAPERLQAAIANQVASDREGAGRLLDLIAAGKVSPRLVQDRALALRLKASQLPEIDRRLEELTRGLPAAEEAIAKLIDLRRGGFAAARADAARGAKVFEKHCASCHQIHGQGARIGPQLDGIGLRGTERLLEDVLDPNRNVDQAFRTTTLALADGRVVSGLLLREEGEVLVLADSKGEEQRVDKSSVEERQLSALSLMPANLVEQISEDDFYDLLRFLLDSREHPAGAASPTNPLPAAEDGRGAAG